MGADIKVEVNPQDIERHVTEAIVASSFGTLLKTAVEKAIESLGNQYSYDNQLKKWVEEKMRAIVYDYVKSQFTTQVEDAIKTWLTSQKMDTLTAEVIERVVSNLTPKERY